jgi:hypothetical protein
VRRLFSCGVQQGAGRGRERAAHRRASSCPCHTAGTDAAAGPRHRPNACTLKRHGKHQPVSARGRAATVLRAPFCPANQVAAPARLGPAADRPRACPRPPPPPQARHAAATCVPSAGLRDGVSRILGAALCPASPSLLPCSPCCPPPPPLPSAGLRVPGLATGCGLQDRARRGEHAAPCAAAAAGIPGPCGLGGGQLLRRASPHSCIRRRSGERGAEAPRPLEACVRTWGRRKRGRCPRFNPVQGVLSLFIWHLFVPRTLKQDRCRRAVRACLARLPSPCPPSVPGPGGPSLAAWPRAGLRPQQI